MDGNAGQPNSQGELESGAGHRAWSGVNRTPVEWGACCASTRRVSRVHLALRKETGRSNFFI